MLDYNYYVTISNNTAINMTSTSDRTGSYVYYISYWYMVTLTIQDLYLINSTIGLLTYNIQNVYYTGINKTLLF